MTARAKRIVIGFDGTEGALRALDAATRMTGYGSSFTVVSVGATGSEGAAALDSARERLLERLVTARYMRRNGEPAEELVGAARELDADLLVVGRHRPFEATNRNTGSVSTDVVRRAPCDVLVVR